jgi:hypothetical protein
MLAIRIENEDLDVTKKLQEKKIWDIKAPRTVKSFLKWIAGAMVYLKYQ